MTEAQDPAQRERDIVRAFVDLSRALADGDDVVELLSHLTSTCAALLDVASAGLLLVDRTGVLRLASASSERTRHLELYQLQREEGPCLDCYHGGEVVVVPDLAAAGARWPHFTQAARSAGYTSVHAVPMRLRDTVLGALGLFGTGVGALDDEDLVLAQALAHVASVALVNERAAADHTTVNAQLERALSSRVALEQAKGVIAHAGGLDMEDAFGVLRRYARDHGRRLSEVAAAVVGRELRGATVLEHARSVGVLP